MDYIKFKVLSTKITPEYLWAYFMSDEGFMQLNLCSHGDAGRNRPLNIKELLNVEIPIPNNISDLERIATAVKLVMSFRAIDKEQTELLDEFKMCLISRVVTGAIDVREIEIPNYEYGEINNFSDEDLDDVDDISEDEEV